MDRAIPKNLAQCAHCKGYTRITPTEERPEEGWILWSDGVLWHPHFASHEGIMRCGVCDRFFLIDYRTKFQAVSINNHPKAGFLSILDIVSILDDKSQFEALAPHIDLPVRYPYKDIDWQREYLEECLRRAVLVKYNDFFRLGCEKEIGDSLQAIFVENAKWLLKRAALKPNVYDFILQAELQRNLGNFSECKAQLKFMVKDIYQTHGEAYRDFKLKMLVECWKGNTKPYAVAETGDGYEGKKASLWKRMKCLMR